VEFRVPSRVTAWKHSGKCSSGAVPAYFCFSFVSIISPMYYTHHYFNTILFRRRGGRILRKLKNSALSVIEKCETDTITMVRLSVSLHWILGQGFFPPSNSIFPCQYHITIAPCSIHLRLSDDLIGWTCGRSL
jgi:hypothetical protein